VETVYARARELCQQLEDAPQLIPVLGGMWSFYLLRGELDLARELAERILALARDVEAPALLLQAHRMMSTTVLWRGELEAVREHLQEVMALYDPQQHRSHAFLYYGLDPGAVCLAIEACALWLLGYPDQSVTKGADALKLAQELAHPSSLAFVLSYIALLDRLRGELVQVRRLAGHDALVVGTDVEPADVVAHDDDDIWPFLRRLAACRCTSLAQHAKDRRHSDPFRKIALKCRHKISLLLHQQDLVIECSGNNRQRLSY
jgi:predicted ATPase